MAGQDGFWEALSAGGPLPGRADRMTLYDALIGDWEVDVIDYEADGSRRTSSGEWHFGWVLEGRAIQDVFIVPTRASRKPEETAGPGNRYGTSIRVYDPRADAWNVTWINPVSGAFNTLVGKKRGDEIVQEGEDHGEPIRWIFSEITSRSFRWRGEVSADEGKTWRLKVEFFARRARRERPVAAESGARSA